MKTLVLAAIRCSLLFLVPSIIYGSSAQWDLDPISGDWNTAENWTPMTVPNGSADTATFGLSNTTDVSISANTEINSIIFTPAATNPYTITASPGLTLTISGVGIVNNSGIAQQFVTAVDGSGNFGKIVFTKSAAAGTSIFTNNGSATANFSHGSGQTAFFDTSTADSGTFVNKGATGFGTNSGGGITVFHDSSTAGSANFTNRAGAGVSTSATVFLDNSTAANGFFTNDGGGTGVPFGLGGQTSFSNNSTAANGTFVNNGATASGGFGGATSFDDSSTAGNGVFVNNGGAASGVAALGGGATFFFGTSTAANGTFINNAAPASGAEGGVTEFGLHGFNFSPSAGNGTFINNGATISGAVGGKTVFNNASTAGAATLIANGGTNGGEGGAIFFEEKSTGGTARIEVFGNGSLDISGHQAPGVTIGSIEGDGNVFLGPNTLTVGSNDADTMFSGVIQDGGIGGGTSGSLTKIGSGTLILSGANTYTGNTNVNRGVLQVDGSIASNTVANPLGTLAGTGTINGNVTNNGKVSPGSAGAPGILIVTGNYTQAQYAHLMIQIAGASAGQFSVLDVLGTANLSGRLDPILLNGFVPIVGETFTFLNYGAVNGTLSILNPNIDNLPEHWGVSHFPTFAVLTVTAGNVPVPDQASTLLLLMLGLSALLMCRRYLVCKQT